MIDNALLDGDLPKKLVLLASPALKTICTFYKYPTSSVVLTAANPALRQSFDTALSVPARFDVEMEQQYFYVEDFCCLKSHLSKTGIVERTHHDVDSHLPDPERSYGSHIARHRTIGRHDFDRFTDNGIPPEHTVLVQWASGSKLEGLELIPISMLKLLDRTMILGDNVQRYPGDTMSGTVIQSDIKVSLVPPATLHLLQRHGGPNGQAATWKGDIDLDRQAEKIEKDHPYILQGIPAEELRLATTFAEGDLLTYDDWIGRIERVWNDIYLQMSYGAVVIPDEPDTIEFLDGPPEVGYVATPKPSHLRYGRWIVGAFDPRADRTGVVVHTEPWSLGIHWLCRRLDGPASRVHSEPPAKLSLREIDPSEIHVYDRMRRPRAGAGLTDRCCLELVTGNSVRFRDAAGAAAKYDGSGTVTMGDGIAPKNHFRRAPSSSNFGYDLNLFYVNSTATIITVMWQDLTITSHKSTELVPDMNYDDESLVWPGEVVVTMERKTPPRDDWLFEPARVGVVQDVNGAERVANVRWFRNASILYHNIADMDESYSGALVPGSTTGTLSADDLVQEVSIYDMKVASGVNKRQGDFVILHPPADSSLNVNKSAVLDWFGQVIDLGLDGRLTVRLGALEEVRDVKIAPEHVTLAYGSDAGDDDTADDHPDSIDEMFGPWDDSEDELYRQAAEDRAAERASQLWYEYDDQNGHATVVASGGNGSDEEAWLTEDDGEENAAPPDIEMTDAHNSSTVERNEADSARDQDVQHESSLNSQESGEGRHTEMQLIPTAVSDAPPNFLILDGALPTFRYDNEPSPTSMSFLRKVGKEHKILASSLPPGIFVRTWESRLDILRVLIVGPLGTPYEFAPFLIDMKLPGDYPKSPPEAFFHSWTNGQGPVNPNLYENGKICLSLLGTWHADSSAETWNPGKSTILQVLVSLLGLVLVREPYYNEAGFEARAGAADSRLSSRLYSERAYFRSRQFITHALRNKIGCYEDVVQWLYLKHGEGKKTPNLLERALSSAKNTIRLAESQDGQRRSALGGGLSTMSKGALVMLNRQVAAMEALPNAG